MDTITREVTARQLRGELATLVNEAAYGNGRIALHRYGSLVAVLIGIEDFQKLRRLEDDPHAREVEPFDEWAYRVAAEHRAGLEAAAGAHQVEDGVSEAQTGTERIGTLPLDPGA